MSEKPSIFKTAPQEYEHPLPAYEEIASKPDYTCSASATYASSRPILFPRECAFFYRITHSHSHLGINKNKPLFLVRTPRFSMGSGDIILLNETDKLDTPFVNFRFMNQGATGELGEVFELAAMISFMRLFELQLSQGGVAIGPGSS
ncbi:hypothetical protein V2G26_019013 [Clonostachys chloroleuca]